MTTDYKTRLPSQFDDATNLRAVVDVVSDIVGEGNTILEYLRDDTALDNAEGVWLDEIGDIVGVTRFAGQMDDATIFAYGSIDDCDPAKAFSDCTVSPLVGGYYVGVDGLPDGSAFADADYRTLIRAKVLSTYSDDSLRAIYDWILAVFGVSAYVYIAGPGEVGVDLPVYMDHTSRRIIEHYAPRAAGIGVGVISWPGGSAPGPEYEDDMSYRFVEATVGGSDTITDAETAVHLIYHGSGAGYSIAFADATTYTSRRLYRLTNQTASAIPVQNSTGSITDLLLPGNVMQCTLSDMSTAAGDWLFVQHIGGTGEEDP